LVEAGNILKCIKCDIEYSKIEIDKLDKEAGLLHEIGSNNKDLQKLVQALTIRERIYGTYGVLKLSTLSALMNLCIANENWELALDYSTQVLIIFKQIYHPNWPLTGLQYFIVGKLEKFLYKLQPAIEHLTKAYGILQITHGSDHELLTELQEMLQETRDYLASLLHNKK